jgi:hypothetical protein
MDESTRRLVPLARAESLRLLGTVPFGRVVFSRQALPAITPVTHVVDAGAIVIRGPGAPPVVPLAHDRAETVVAYEADVIDPLARIGWSVVVVGAARLVTDPRLLVRYEALLPRWVAEPEDQLIRITPELVTGYRFVNDNAVDAAVDAVPT